MARWAALFVITLSLLGASPPVLRAGIDTQGANEYFRNATFGDFAGGWERVPLPPGTSNHFEPWPSPFQYFYFTNDGRIGWIMSSQVVIGISQHELKNLLDKAGWYHLISTNHGGYYFFQYTKNMREVWFCRLALKDHAEGTLTIKAGDIMMLLMQPDKEGRLKPVNVRQLRRLPE
jgi:hypothetical protein